MNRRILAIVVALALAIGGGLLVISYARNADARAIAEASPAPVWVSQQPVPVGTTLKDAQRTGLIAQTSVSSKAVPAGALQEINADNNALLATSDIPAGEYLLAARFGTTPQGTKAIEVPSGMLAVSLALSDPARVGKFVTPGSHIALFQTYTIKDLRDTPEAKILNENQVHGTSLLLPDVLVIAMGDAPLAGQAAAPPAEGQPATAAGAAGGYLVTVAVKPADATLLIHGIANRQLYAGLRGSDVKVDPKLEVTDLQLRDAVAGP
ncbi:Flp pilus assembly protein CpaB [Terrabacter sp. Soil810]|uniref:Flp pilus assembly protein CpaB n=1 Tax=Terrabacter sp. Soil810 TaxID=1736418 RepID=UPI00070EF7F7|nr:RcpC/CpaB family pilus assembly protein [Terrabacter sp. Soil810]KRF46784.1 pilus assembly protein CpaB [Terrabacter sp. Soil810]